MGKVKQEYPSFNFCCIDQPNAIGCTKFSTKLEQLFPAVYEHMRRLLKKYEISKIN
jgi:hypothetical protein